MNRRRLAVLSGLGIAVIAALVGPALAANDAVPDGNAGQSLTVVAGFTVTAVQYVTATGATAGTAELASVRFTIARDGSATPVDDVDTTVYVQLRTTAANRGWSSCTVDAGSASCDTSAVDATAALSDVTGLSVVAYDSAPVTTTSSSTTSSSTTTTAYIPCIYGGVWPACAPAPTIPMFGPN